MNSIKFKNINYLPLTNSDQWNKVNKAELGSDGYLKIPSEGAVYFDITDFKDVQFKYYKLEINIGAEGLDQESAVDSDVVAELFINYKNYTGEVGNTEAVVMGISPYNIVNTETFEYFDSKILDTLDMQIYSCRFQIKNHLGTDIILKSAKLFTSDDFSESQFLDAFNKYNENNKAIRGTIGTNEDMTELRYIKAYTKGSSSYVKIKPQYVGNLLLSINLSNGEALNFDYEKDEDEVQSE